MKEKNENIEEKLTIAAFDFDGTITTKDSFFNFLIYSFGYFHFIKKTIIIAPKFFWQFLNSRNRDNLKQIVFASFFRNMNVNDFNNLCEKFLEKLKNIISEKAMSKINWHKSQGHIIIIISASIYNWIYPWAKKNGIFTVIGTEIEIKNNLITGNFSTPNCRRKEKVIRLLDQFPKESISLLYAYGDSNGDKELLEYADHSFFRCF